MADPAFLVESNVENSQKLKWFHDFCGYLVVGGLAFVVDFCIYFGLVSAGLEPLVAAPAGFVAGLVVNYALAARYVFREHRLKRRSLEFIAYAAIGILGLCVNEAVIWIAIDFAHAHAVVAKVLATGFVFLFNFAARRALLFSKGDHVR